MRRLGLLGTVVAVFAMAGVALALSYKTGTFKAGAQSGTSKTGLTLAVHKGSFAVKRISYPEKCTGGDPVIHDQFNFFEGSNAKLTGKIGKKGKFSGQYKTSGATLKVSGTVHGKTATVDSTETNKFTPQASTATYTCRGSHTFTAKKK
jgi:hypothetical protein